MSWNSPRSRAVATVALAGALLAALSGCTFGTPATGGPSTSAAAPTDTSSPTSSPTDTPLTMPQPTIPLGCADILTLHEAQQYITAPIKVRADETTLPVDYLAPRVQAGDLECVWGGDTRTDNGYDDGVVVDLSPDSADAYADSTQGQSAVSVPGASKAAIDCEGDGSTITQCWANALIASNWLSVSFSSTHAPVPSTSTAKKDVVQLMGVMAGRIVNAGDPRDPWPIPDDALTAKKICGSTAAQQALATAFQASDLQLEQTPLDDPSSQIVAARTGFDECTFSLNGQDAGDPSEVTVSVLPGGTWALAPSGGTQPASSGVELSEYPLAGNSHFFAGCSEYCTADAVVDDSFVFFQHYTSDLPLSDDFATEVAQFLQSGAF